MKLLILNPNTTQALTDRLAASAARVLPDDAQIIRATATIGFPYISSRAEAQIAGAEALAMLASLQGEYDAAVIAAFGDPGLTAARELFDKPVTGMSEAAMLTALSLGERFALVTFAPALVAWYGEQVTRVGLEKRFAGTFTPDASFGEIATVAEDMRAPLVETCNRAAREADVVILAGAPIAGLAGDIAEDVPAILLDPVQAAAMQAYGLCRLRPKGSNAGSFARPPAKESTGLPGALAAWIARAE
ncbi:aspartate/glutamate racemase family protein [Oricola sp.]|uniref:aspartate/glutamate racemase family protein n=1 Tax=Oricola sp. TaxID=1979950 RepID=UPI0025D31B03|nr:aspartate/glutamate racemase family protein [Oricola sp.]MCI5075099.1 aspartate/glutamate racemase family protein [Oricola sp.]